MNIKTGGVSTPSTVNTARGRGSSVQPIPSMPVPRPLNNKPAQTTALRNALQANMNSAAAKAGKSSLGIGGIPAKFR